MKPIKITVDKHTFPTVLYGLAAWSTHLSLFAEDMKNAKEFAQMHSEHSAYMCAHALCEKLSAGLRGEMYVRLKLNASEAFAFRHVVELAQPADPWSNAKLIEIADLLDQHCAMLIKQHYMNVVDFSGQLNSSSLKGLG